MTPTPVYPNNQSDGLESPPAADTGEQMAGEERWIEIGRERLALLAVLESLLFVADAPVEPAQIAKILNLDKRTVEAGLQTLAHSYETPQRGLRIQEHNGRFQLVTRPAVAALI